MHPLAAKALIQHLHREGVLHTRAQTFWVDLYPRILDNADIHEAFCVLAESMGFKRRDLTKFTQSGYIVRMPEKMFEKLYGQIFSSRKLAEKNRETREPAPLPVLFIGREKTQVRQIPVVSSPPWPFHFLMEMGGMIVVSTRDRKRLYESLRQYLNNHPQYDVRVDAKELPDGKISIFTYWFQELKITHRKEHMNVPH